MSTNSLSYYNPDSVVTPVAAIVAADDAACTPAEKSIQVPLSALEALGSQQPPEEPEEEGNNWRAEASPSDAATFLAAVNALRPPSIIHPSLLLDKKSESLLAAAQTIEETFPASSSSVGDDATTTAASSAGGRAVKRTRSEGESDTTPFAPRTRSRFLTEDDDDDDDAAVPIVTVLEPETAPAPALEEQEEMNSEDLPGISASLVDNLMDKINYTSLKYGDDFSTELPIQNLLGVPVKVTFCGVIPSDEHDPLVYAGLAIEPCSVFFHGSVLYNSEWYFEDFGCRVSSPEEMHAAFRRIAASVLRRLLDMQEGKFEVDFCHRRFLPKDLHRKNSLAPFLATFGSTAVSNGKIKECAGCGIQCRSVCQARHFVCDKCVEDCSGCPSCSSNQFFVLPFSARMYSRLR